MHGIGMRELIMRSGATRVLLVVVRRATHAS
jgi:hypothetical protein